MMPVRPPKRNVTRKPSANSIAVSKVSWPRQIVPVQLKNFTPVGTAIRNVMKEKKGSSTAPVVYMWCAHTVMDSATIDTSGWPKNQNRCCQRIAPPLAESNTCAPSLRSISSTSKAAASTGNASSTRMLVSRMFQVKMGIRNIVMPGARMQKIVVTKFTPDKIVPNPDSTNPMIHMSPPSPGEYTELVSGE